LHPFFFGVNWNAIRQIDAPFIPRLKSITDTSYFPTDELEQVPDEPVGGDSTGANKDLAFLGYVVARCFLFECSISAFCAFA
jgi:protein-serine/threonine kinase